MGYNREANENPRTMVVPGLEEIRDVASFAGRCRRRCGRAALLPLPPAQHLSEAHREKVILSYAVFPKKAIFSGKTAYFY